MKQKRNILPARLFAALLALLWLAAAAPALAQSEEETLRLRMSRVIGYSSLGRNEFQGVMNLEARGPESLERVVFYIDGQPMGESSQAPFRLRFSTGDYSLGTHTLTAVGYTADGRELQSNPIQAEFVTAEAGWQAGLRIIIPMLVIIFGLMAISLLFMAFTGRGRKDELPLGTPRNYGFAGGAICPRCSRPFPLRALAINLSPVHKLERCPYCGKLGVMRRRSLQQLRAAEAAELEMAQSQGLTPTLSEEEKLRKELEDSRFL